VVVNPKSKEMRKDPKVTLVVTNSNNRKEDFLALLKYDSGEDLLDTIVIESVLL
jgi:hypothetical protein